MRSLIVNSTFSIIKYFKALYHESLTFRAISNFKAWLRVLTSSSWILTFLKSESFKNYDETRFAHLSHKLKLNIATKKILYESKVLRFITKPTMLGFFWLIHIVSYGILPTSLSILLSLALIILIFLFTQFNETVKAEPIFIISGLFLLGMILMGGLLNTLSYDTLTILMIYGMTTLLVFTLGLYGNHKKIFTSILFAIGLTVFLYSLYGIYQRIVGVAVDPAWLDENASHQALRIFSVFNNPNVFGEFLVLTVPLMFAGSQVSKKLWMKLAFFCIFALGALNILLTYSRGSMISLAFAMVIIVVIRDRRYMPLLILGFVMSPFILPEAIWARIMTVFQGGDTSTDFRVSIYLSSIDMLRDHFLLGVGFGNFKEVFKLYAYTASKSFHAHNTWLMLWLEMGLVGLLAWLTFLGAWTKQLFTLKDRNAYSYYAVAAFAGVVGCSLQGMVDHIFHNYDILFYYLLVVVFGFMAIRLSKEANHV
jgi:O-antigen ligase